MKIHESNEFDLYWIKQKEWKNQWYAINVIKIILIYSIYLMFVKMLLCVLNEHFQIKYRQFISKMLIFFKAKKHFNVIWIYKRRSKIRNEENVEKIDVWNLFYGRENKIHVQKNVISKCLFE
jgi:hypothetical protein